MQRKFYGLQREYVNSSIKFKNLKSTDTFNEDPIVNIDFKKKIVVTENEGTYYYYYVSNIDSKPSLYGAKSYRYIDL